MISASQKQSAIQLKVAWAVTLASVLLFVFGVDASYLLGLLLWSMFYLTVISAVSFAVTLDLWAGQTASPPLGLIRRKPYSLPHEPNR